MKKTISKILIGSLLAIPMLWASMTSATVYQGYQGGTGFGTSSAGTVGQVLTVASTSPWLTYSFTTPAGTQATTTINGASGPALTLLISSSTNTLSISTSTNTVTITIPANLGWFVNDSGYLTSATAASTYVPYTGATTNVNLGANTLTVGATTTLATTTATDLTVSGKSNLLSTTTIGRAASSTDETLDVLGTLGIESSVGVDALYVKSNGYVGIGTSTPSTVLHVNGTTTLSTTTLSNIATGSFLATDGNRNIIATTTPSGSAGFTIPALSTTSVPLASTTLSTDANLNAYYQLNSTTSDFTANHYDMTATDIAYVAGVSTPFQNAGSFNGTSSIAKINSNVGLSSPNNNSLSVWVKLNAEISSGVWTFIYKTTGVSPYVGLRIDYQYNSGTRRLSFNYGQEGIADNPSFYNITLGTSNWYHLVLTYDGTNIRGYVNGSLVSGPTAASGSGNSIYNQASANIGAVSDPSSGSNLQFANAIEDDASFFGKTLTATEISNLYNHVIQQYVYSTSTVSLATTSKQLNDTFITLTVPGTYLIQPRVNVHYNDATFASSQTASFKLRRNNNTAADILNSTSTVYTAIVTTSSSTVVVNQMPAIIYTTANSNDELAIYDIISNLPSAGSVDVTESSIIATRLY